jgi:hypothetical protein
MGGMTIGIDYRSLAHRQEGFDWFFKAMCESEDVDPELACDRWIADDAGWNFEKRCVLALHHGSAASGLVGTLFADKFPLMTSNVTGITGFFKRNKKRLPFSSDAKYRKAFFEKFLVSVGRTIKPYGTLGKLVGSCLQGSDSRANYLKLQKLCEPWLQWGRMGHWCFAEALFRVADAPIEPPTMEFGKHGKSHTSGWAFCMGRDDLAEKGPKWTDEEIQYLEKSAAAYLAQFRSMYPKLVRADYYSLETACCNYKRGHKGSRYQLCYIDEQHTELTEMMRSWQEYRWLWKKYMEARQTVLPATLLFENHTSEAANTSPQAYVDSWTKSLKDFGRMPRVEAYINGKPQGWFEPFVA